MPEHMQNLVDFYSPYLMGTLDTLVLLSDIISSADQKRILDGVILSIIRDSATTKEKK